MRTVRGWSVSLVLVLAGCSSPIPKNGCAVTDASASCGAGTSCVAGECVAQLIDAGRPNEPDGGSACLERFDEGLAIGVSANGVDSASCGSPQSPCQTITQGIERAAAAGKPLVLVAAGRYAESFSLRPFTKVIGGFSITASGWFRSCACDRSLVTVLGVTDRVVEALDLDGGASLECLSLETTRLRASPNGDGESLYGVFSRGESTTLELVNVRVFASAAGDGRPAPSAAAPMPNRGPCSAGDGGPAEAGLAAVSPAEGSFTAEGYQPRAGPLGTVGANGNNGPLLTPPDSSPSCGICSGVPPCVRVANAATALPGIPGCGGTGGRTPPAGGGGGGASVVIFSAGSTVRVRDSELVSSHGGEGGVGAAGTAGLPGSPGFAGAGRECSDGCEPCQGDLCPSMCVASDLTYLMGGTAGAGGAGGPGGASAGGAGGPSYAVVKVVGTVSLTNTTSMHDTGGAGGLHGDGSTRAPSGRSGNEWP